MTKQEFDMSKNLLKDVISKQTGSLTKAIKELVQNSRDAGSTEILINIAEDKLIVSDNGRGMTPKEINVYFRVFGETLKRNSEKDDGQFGMGRGQIMNFGVCVWRTQQSKIDVDIRKFLGYDLKELKTSLKGCKVICIFHKKLDWWSQRKALSGIRSDLLPKSNLKIIINDKELKPEIKILEQFTDKKFDVFMHPTVINKIYCRGLGVKNFSSNFNYCINIKQKVELNFARNEFLETDPMYEEIKAKRNEVEELMTITKDHFDNREARQTLQFVKDGRVSLEAIINKAIVRTATDKKYTLAQLIGEEIMFGECNIWSDDCIAQEHIVLHSDNEYLIAELIRKLKLNIKISDKKPKDIAKRGYHRTFDESKLKKNKIYSKIPYDMDKFIFKSLGEEYNRDVYLGESDIHSGWTDGYSYIYVDRKTIEKSQNKEEICIKVWIILCHEYAHDEDNKKKDYHSHEFYEEYHKLTRITTKKIAEYIKMVSAKRLKELYF